MKNEQKIKWLAIVNVLYICMLAQASSEVFFSMDLKISYDSATDTSTLEMFPSVKNVSSFRVECYDTSGTVVHSEDFPGSLSIIKLSNIATNTWETVQVFALDVSETVLEKTPVELLIQVEPSVSEDANISSTGGPGCGLDLILKDTETSTFPWIYATLKAEDSSGSVISDLTVDDFFVTEDSRPQAFQLIRQFGVDVVFCIDTSGSMGEEINQVKNNVRSFAQALEADNVDYRLAIVSFGQNGGPHGYGQPYTYQSFTDDVTVFENAVGSLSAGGGTEPGFCAVYHSLTDASLLWRPGFLKVIVIITDEDNDSGCYIPGGDINVCQKISNEEARVFAASNHSDYTSFLINCSNPPGKYDSVTADINNLLAEIWDDIVGDYVVFYETDNPVEDCAQRHVEITATHEIFNQGTSTCSDMEDFYYTPNASPKIKLTQHTIDLHNTPVIENDPQLICAEVTDCASPYVSSVILFVRTTGVANYTSINMTPSPNNIWRATVPSNIVITPGIDYYIFATDGDKNSTNPSSEPESNPHQIAVLPNVAPGIAVTCSKPCYEPNSIVEFVIDCDDVTNHVSQVDLFWRPLGQLVWRNAYSGQYSAQDTSVQVSTFVDANECPSGTTGIEYYVSVKDNHGVTATWPVAGRGNPAVLMECVCYNDLVLDTGTGPDPIYIQPHDSVLIDMNALCLMQPVYGCQAVMNFDSTYFVSEPSGAGSPVVVAGGYPWDELIYNIWTVEGDMDVAVGIHLDELYEGTQEDGTVAKIELTSNGTEGITQMIFRPDVSDVEETIFADIFANPVYPNKRDSQDIVIDGTPPVVDVRSFLQEQCIPGGSPFELIWVAVDENDCFPQDAVTLEYYDGNQWVLIAENERNDGSYLWDVPEINLCGAVLRVSVSDCAGNIGEGFSVADFCIDSLAPEVVNITATQDGGADLTPAPFKPNAVQGTVLIEVTTSDNLCGVAAPPVVEVQDADASPFTVTYVGPNGPDAYQYSIEVTPTTANGIAAINVIGLMDTAGNIADPKVDTFSINKNQISGLIELEELHPMAAGLDKEVVFIATGSNTESWTMTIHFPARILPPLVPQVPYVLTDVPDGVTGLSAKTCSHLRRKLTGLTLDGNGQVVNANFTGTHFLKGGDFNNSNTVNILDFALLKGCYLKEVATNSICDCIDADGNGVVNFADFVIFRKNYFKYGDSQ